MGWQTVASARFSSAARVHRLAWHRHDAQPSERGDRTPEPIRMAWVSSLLVRLLPEPVDLA